MNARFRKGNVYKFKVNDARQVYIASLPLVYTRYSRGHYHFKTVHNGIEQKCPRFWIEDCLVSVKTEWDKTAF